MCQRKKSLNLVINELHLVNVVFLWLKKIYSEVSKYCMHMIFEKVSYSMLLGIICSKSID